MSQKQNIKAVVVDLSPPTLDIISGRVQRVDSFHISGSYHLVCLGNRRTTAAAFLGQLTADG